jgi:uncharacterized membrane protein
MLPRADIKRMARDQIKGNIGAIFVCMLLVGLITAVSGVTFIGPIILAPVFMLSMTRIYLKLTEGTAPEAKDIFTGFDNILNAVVLELLIGVFTFLWTLLLFVPGIIKALSYSMSFYILAENPGMTATEALNESKRMTKGYKGKLFMLGLSFILWFLLGSVTLGIAYIYVVPYVSTTMANFYKELKVASEYNLQ